MTAAVLALLVAAGAGAAWLARGPIAGAAIEAWLARQGVEAEVVLDRVGLDGAAGRARLGAADAPDLTVARIEVEYAVIAPWAGGLSLRPSRIVLTGPRLRAAWRDGALDLGALDRLAARLAQAPADPDAPSPVVEVRDGRLSLDTPWGPADARVDARLQDGRLRRLVLAADDVALDGPAGRARIDRLGIGAATVGDRLAVRLRTRGATVEGEALAGAGLEIALGIDTAWPAEAPSPPAGPARLAATVTGERLAFGDLVLTRPAMTVAADGALTSSPAGVTAFAGEAEARLEAAAGAVGATRFTAPAAQLEGPLRLGRTGPGEDAGWSWRLDGPAQLTAARLDGPGLAIAAPAARSARLSLGGDGAAVEATGPVRISAGALGAGDLALRTLDGEGRLDLRAGETLIAGFEGALGARGAWPLLGPASAGEPPEVTAMKQALADLSLSAPALRLGLAGGALRLELGQPLTATPATGGRLTVTALDGRPVFAAGPGDAPGGGAFRLASAPGGGLPALEATVPRWSLRPGGLAAEVQGRATLDFAPAEDLTLTADGTLTTGTGGLTFRPDGCVAVTAARLELGENDAEAVAGELCPRPGQAPWLTVADGSWRLTTALRGGAARLPGFEAAVEAAAGPVTVTGGDALALEAPALTARLVDTAEPLRFKPLAAAGPARLVDEVWSGRFDLTPQRYAAAGPLAAATFRHDGRSGTGALTLEAPDLVFAARGLQPGDLTPLGGEVLGPPVEGAAAFTGRFDWTPDGTTSEGVAEIRDLAFESPLGRVEGLNSRLVFDSLAPLTTDPGQRITAEAVAAFAPLNDLRLSFALAESAVRIEGGRATAAGGVIRVEPFDAPLTPGAELSGALVFEGVELGEILRTLGLGEDIRIDARVSGRLPFTRLADGRLRISGGQLAAVEPGRLSIPRSALSQVAAAGGGLEGAPGDSPGVEAGDAPPNVVEDLAYQAMENLAYDRLTATVDSVGDGRMRLRFNVDGRHDPPQQQEIRLSWMDLIRRRFTDKPLPLPSGTEIDLTLDVDFNADELFGDLIALQAARNGAAAP
jgi:hypothetical protein